MKKGQVTVFIIIGILVLIIFAMVYYFRNAMGEEDIENTIQRIRALFREQGKYNTYVTNCLNQAANEAFITAGKQGGAIYDTQINGTKRFLGPPDYSYGEYVLPSGPAANAYNVSYGISRPILGSQYHPDIPFYPYGLTTLVTNPRVISPFYVNVFGNFPRSPLVPLCDYHGSNRLSLSSTVACETYDSRAVADTNNVQQYLEAFIENRTARCVRLDTLPELENMNVRKGNVTVNITFAENDIEVVLSMPIWIEVGSFNAEIQLDMFDVSKRLRIKKIHELASHLIQRDINDIYFDIVRDAGKLTDCKDITGGNSRCLKQGMFVQKIRNPYAESNDDLLVISDREYKLEGVPYIYQVAIQNRAPALDLIRDEIGTGSFNYDYVVFAGDTITIEPKGIDPDEDQHNHLGEMEYTYNYYGWKETQDAYFNCVTGCSIQDESYVVTFDIGPGHPAYRSWTSSTLYNSTRRDASYTTQARDLGIHNVKVEVCDKADLCDYQNVIILVINGTFAGGASKYMDIGAGHGSLEDPYSLVTPITFDLYPSESNLRYEWEMQRPDTSLWPKTTIDPNISLPESSYTIQNIDTQMSPYFNTIGEYSIMVDIVRQDDSIVSTGDPNPFTVHSCLPHRSSSPPYPYHTTDPFQANHTCCYGQPNNPDEPNWGTIIDTSNTCYTSHEYGCREDPGYKTYPGFSQTLCAEPDVSCIDPASPVYSDGITNDVYKRTFSRKCDGVRGNTCEGDMLDTRDNIKECPECQTCQYGQQDCQDIPFGTKICNGGIKKCTQGPGSTYESSGVWSCEGMCANGVCNSSVNCVCDTACGAECESDTDYKWTDDECIFDCLDSSACTYDGLDYTRCSSPDPLDTACYIENSLTICPSDPTYFNTLSGQGYNSYCLDGDYCYFNVSCSGSGVDEVQGDKCLPGGTISGNKCYTQGTDCLANGTCNSVDIWEDMNLLVCDEGSHLTANCRRGEQCYNTTCDTQSGWYKTPSSVIDLDGTWYNCAVIGCSMGYTFESGTCYSGMECTTEGWSYAVAETMPATSCPPTQNWICTASGWSCT